MEEEILPRLTSEMIKAGEKEIKEGKWIRLEDLRKELEKRNENRIEE